MCCLLLCCATRNCYVEQIGKRNEKKLLFLIVVKWQTTLRHATIGKSHILQRCCCWYYRILFLILSVCTLAILAVHTTGQFNLNFSLKLTAGHYNVVHLQHLQNLFFVCKLSCRCQSCKFLLEVMLQFHINPVRIKYKIQ